MISLVVCGAAGRMGRRIISRAIAEKDWKIVGAVDQANSPFLGEDAGALAGEGNLGIALTNDKETVFQQADVIIDFSQPEATLESLELAKKCKKALVVGTTGFTDKQKETFSAAASEIPVLMAPNMSVGVNLLFELASEAASKLGPEYDIEIVEAHHRHKKDAPSGTAEKLADLLAEARGLDRKKGVIYGRHGNSAERKGDEIVVHALRAGDIVGDHTVTFCAPGERIELTHRAHSRDTFANGALSAARFLTAQKPGLYSMHEVLNSK